MMTVLLTNVYTHKDHAPVTPAQLHVCPTRFVWFTISCAQVVSLSVSVTVTVTLTLTVTVTLTVTLTVTTTVLIVCHGMMGQLARITRSRSR